VASLAALVTAMVQSLGNMLRKVFPVDLHQVPNVATNRDVVEARVTQRAPLSGVGSVAIPTDPPAPSLLPVTAMGPGPLARGFSRAHLLALFLMAMGAAPERIYTFGTGTCRSG
jgi:hypothetical protein